MNINSVDGEKIVIRGAREHNLKNIDIDIPRNKLVVVSGLSGSGKSSFAFDTLFAEGQRRYVESLSSYARQFLGTMDKPDVDLIEGLSPAISIEQKTTHKNPRSTVGTVTEIYDYYRLLFARIGTAHCPNCGREIHEQSVDQIIDAISSWQSGTKIQILSPVIRGKKGEHQKVIEDAIKSGFARARIDGIMTELDSSIKLDKQKKHTIELVIDRIVLKNDIRNRLADSVETALKSANGIISVVRRINKGEEGFEEVVGEIARKGGTIDTSKDYIEQEIMFSQKNACPECGISIPELQPRLFSFNNPFGACPECTGLGEKMEWDFEKILPDKSLSFNQKAFPFYNPESSWNKSFFKAVSEEAGFSLDTPIKDLTKEQFDYLWNGNSEIKLHWVYEKQSGEGYSSYDRPWNGIISDMKRRYNESWSDAQRTGIEEKFMTVSECSCCHGQRLRQEALGVTVGGKNIHQLCILSVSESIDFFNELQLSDSESQIAAGIVKEIRSRLTFLQNVGLDYLTMERAAETLSGGEAQRVKLANELARPSTSKTLYILDEPTTGLHFVDVMNLMQIIHALVEKGNSVVMIEHNLDVICQADHIIDLGPEGGAGGGKIIATGTPEEVAKIKGSYTGKYVGEMLEREKQRDNLSSEK